MSSMNIFTWIQNQWINISVLTLTKYILICIHSSWARTDAKKFFKKRMQILFLKLSYSLCWIILHISIWSVLMTVGVIVLFVIIYCLYSCLQIFTFKRYRYTFYDTELNSFRIDVFCFLTSSQINTVCKNCLKVYYKLPKSVFWMKCCCCKIGPFQRIHFVVNVGGICFCYVLFLKP